MNFRIVRQRLNQRINAWFTYTEHDDPSPEDSSYLITDAFETAIQGSPLSLCIHSSRLHAYVCEAICTFYRASLAHEKRVAAPHPKKYFPRGWTPNIEVMWIDYLTHKYFHEAFWMNFWKNIPEAVWESEVSSELRPFLTCVLPIYIARNLTLLEDAGLIACNHDGEYVKREDVQDAEEYDERI